MRWVYRFHTHFFLIYAGVSLLMQLVDGAYGRHYLVSVAKEGQVCHRI
jgi:hypothetical protein